MNDFEKKIHDALVARGYTVLRNGWPDFLVMEKDRPFGLRPRGFALELKRGADRVRDEQVEMHRALAQFGVLTHVVRDDAAAVIRKKGRLLLLESDLHGMRESLQELERHASELNAAIENQRKALASAEVLFEAGPPPASEADRAGEILAGIVQPKEDIQ